VLTQKKAEQAEESRRREEADRRQEARRREEKKRLEGARRADEVRRRKVDEARKAEYDCKQELAKRAAMEVRRRQVLQASAAKASPVMTPVEDDPKLLKARRQQEFDDKEQRQVNIQRHQHAQACRLEAWKAAEDKKSKDMKIALEAWRSEQSLHQEEARRSLLSKRAC
jgi:hypothetical protein